jgi:NDP-sugar pyrophosphorylase family protein
MKEKISVTISTDLIQRADSLIDGTMVRNRSQALESLIRKGLSERSIDCAVILAGGGSGGSGKSLAHVEGVPVLINTIRNMKKAGITKIVIAAGRLTERTRELLDDGSGLGVRIIYVDDGDSGTAGAVHSASEHIKGPFFVVFGDVFFDFDLSKMASFHLGGDDLATIAISVTPLGESMDSIKITGNKITEFRYKVGNVRTHHVNAGIYLFEKAVLGMIPKSGSLEKTVLPMLASEGKLSGFVFSGAWRPLG